MKVEVVKPVLYGAQIVRSGTLDVSESVANHWITTGAARLHEPVKPPADPPPADRGGQNQKRY